LACELIGTINYYRYNSRNNKNSDKSTLVKKDLKRFIFRQFPIIVRLFETLTNLWLKTICAYVNVAARLVYNLKRSEHIPVAFISLHWGVGVEVWFPHGVKFSKWYKNLVSGLKNHVIPRSQGRAIAAMSINPGNLHTFQEFTTKEYYDRLNM
jgi:hypothetical protein